MRTIWVAFFAALACMVIFSEAKSQQHPACIKRGEMLKHLGHKYSEAPVALGLANNGGVIEVLTSPTGDSWTIIITMPNGTACMIAAGENWEKVPVKIKEKPSA